MAVIIDGLTYASWLFIIAVGLTLIYGVMKILNIAHGSMLLVLMPPYILVVYGSMGTSLPSFLVMFITSIFIGILFGAIIERGILKRMYDKDEIVLVLVTYAIFLILEDLIKLIWGVDHTLFMQPMACLEVLQLLILYQTIIFCFCICDSYWFDNYLCIKKHNQRKNTFDDHGRKLSLSQGVNVSFVYFLTFIVGASWSNWRSLTAP